MFQVADKIDTKTATVIVKEISTIKTTPPILHWANRNVSYDKTLPIEWCIVYTI